MSQFEKFTEVFHSTYKSYYNFIKESEDNPESLIFKGKLIADNDNSNYDSYGNEDTTLERIFYFEELDIHIKFAGTRQSYNGTDWDTMEEVKPKTIQITIYE